MLHAIAEEIMQKNHSKSVAVGPTDEIPRDASLIYTDALNLCLRIKTLKSS